MKKLPPSPSGKPRRHWFGDTRTVEQQLTGLEYLLSGVAGRTVLDVGCAEGAIAIACALRSKRAVFGVELVPEFVDEARRHARAAGAWATFVQGDANRWAPAAGDEFDIVLMLAILQKLRDPSAAARRIARCARHMVVIRLPPSGPVIVDRRSGDKPHDIEAALLKEGFVLACTAEGPIAEAGEPEWVGYFERVA